MEIRVRIFFSISLKRKIRKFLKLRNEYAIIREILN